MGRPTGHAAKALAATGVVLLFFTVPAFASHGPSRAPTDPCNGAPGLGVDNVITREFVDTIAAQNGGSTSSVTHALISASGHVALQVRETTVPFARVTFEFAPTNSSWSRDSTNHPGYLTAIEAREDPARDADGDIVLGKTFVFFIPTDVVSDGNYVARIRAFRADGSEVGRLCVDAIVSNGQGVLQLDDANTNPSYEPSENAGAGFGFIPQPVAWFPAAEPSAAQQAGYAAKELRLEFVEPLSSVKVEREETSPTDPTVKIWVNYTSRLAPDNFSRPHFIAGGRFDETPFEAFSNQKVWGPGFKFSFAGLSGEALPNERLRATATDLAGKTFCGIYGFSSGDNGSFLASAPGRC